MTLHIRPATQNDAEEAVALLRQSITMLCTADHRDNQQEIDDWLANKTTANWAAWLQNPNASVIVAERAGQIASVGMLSHDGVILLNYVAPAARFSGVSKATLNALESAAAQHGNTSCALNSSQTALRFYLARGYAPVAGSNVSLHLSKSLQGAI